MHIYDKKLNGEMHPCEVCGTNEIDSDTGNGRNIQHHIGHRRYSDKAIWVCLDCHKKIHDNPSWAYQNGYLLKHNNMKVQKKVKNKSCNHSVSYFNRFIGKTICQLCGKPVETTVFKSYRKPRSNASETNSKVKPGKMGFEENVDARVKQAENLKLKRIALKKMIKEEGELNIKNELKLKLQEIETEMRILQKSYED